MSKICLKCNAKLGIVIVDGVAKNIDPRRFCLNCSPFGSFKKDITNHYDVDKKSHVVKKCRKHGIQKHYLETRSKSQSGYYRCMQCKRDVTNRKRKSKKHYLVEQFGGKCELCGYNECEEVLSFHHVDPNSKLHDVSEIHKNIELLFAEAKKCILVCANCHGEVENGFRAIPENLIMRCTNGG